MPRREDGNILTPSLPTTALVVFFSKSLLRHALTRSPKSDFVGDSAFEPVIADSEDSSTIGGPNTISRVILCTGQVYAALRKYRETNDIRDVAIVRIEELNPFPFAQLKATLDLYPNAGTIVWAQEEHYNGGAWHHVRDRVGTVLDETEHHARRRVVYAGRAVSATTAAAKKKVHLQEEEALLRDAFSVME